MTSSIAIISSIFAPTTVAAASLLAMSACLNQWHGRRGDEKQPVYAPALDRRRMN